MLSVDPEGKAPKNRVLRPVLPTKCIFFFKKHLLGETTFISRKKNDKGFIGDYQSILQWADLDKKLKFENDHQTVHFRCWNTLTILVIE